MPEALVMKKHKASSFSYDDADYKYYKIRRRMEWAIEQEMMKQHEKQKQKMIEEYERRRAEKLGLPYKRDHHKDGRRSRSCSRSRSGSSERHRRTRVMSAPSRTEKKSDKRSASQERMSNFKGPKEAPNIKPDELKFIKVTIHRAIPKPDKENNEIRFDVNPEEIVVKRREGEGEKPIFDREELKVPEVEERRTIEAIGKITLDKKVPKRRSVSLSPRRHRSPSPRPSSSHSSHRSRATEHNSSGYRRDSRDYYHREYRSDRYPHKSESSKEDSRRRQSPRSRSYSRGREHHKSDHDHHHSSRSDKDRDHHRGSSSERYHERRDRRDSSRENRLPSGPFVEPLPFPVYYGAFPPRPMMIGPPMRPPPPMVRGHMPPMPIRPMHPPRFMPPNSFGPEPMGPPNRFGRMF